MLFVCALEFLARFFKLHDLHGQLHIGSVMSRGAFLLRGLRCALFPAKVFFGILSFSYLQQSSMLWVLCMPPCCLRRAQCFASLWDFFGIQSLKATIHFLEEPPPVTLALGPSHSFLVRKASSMRPSTSSSLRTLWGTVAPVSLY